MITTGNCIDLNINVLNQYWGFKESEGKILKGKSTWSRNDHEYASIGYVINLAKSFIELSYSANDKPLKYKVNLTYTKPAYGGKRWWFICPNTGERCGVLFLAPNQESFCSRSAFKRLPYTSQHESYWERVLRKKHKLMKKYSITDHMLLHFERPKGMHHKTYKNALKELDRMDEKLYALEQYFIGRLVKTSN